MDASDALAFLSEELKNQDTEIRINAVRKISDVAKLLGADRTKAELIPILQAQLEDDDEVLLSMADQLGGFVPLVGGAAAAVCLLPLLASLAMVEETVVRDKAVESAVKVIGGLPPALNESHAVPLLQQLAAGEWFTARVSATGLFAATYANLSGASASAADARKSLRAAFAVLSTDDMPMVRRAVSKNIGIFATAVEPDALRADILPLFNELAKDDQDSVRLLAIENAKAIAAAIGVADAQANVLPLVKACASDKSWRVRHNVAKEFAPLSAALGALDQLTPLFAKLLRDPEGEVRAAACRNAAGYLSLVGQDAFAREVLPALAESATDCAQPVRIAATEALMALAAAFSSEAAMSMLSPHILHALNDETPEVQLAVLNSLAGVAPVLGASNVEETLIPVLVALAEDPVWRVRDKVISQLPMLAKSLGKALFQEKLLPLYIGCFQDQVHAVRMTATRCVEQLALCLGEEWASTHLLPRLQELFSADGSPYLQRITALLGLRALCVPGAAGVAADVLPLVLKATRDNVPNVRAVAANVLGAVGAAGAFAPAKVADDVRPALAALAADADSDARFAAELALEKLTAAGL